MKLSRPGFEPGCSRKHPRRVRCCSLPPPGHSRADGWVRNQHEAVYGTAAFLNRATSAFPKRCQGQSNPPPRPSQGHMQNHYTTDTVSSSPGWIQNQRRSYPLSRECQPLNDGTVMPPTRIQIWNVSFEARYDRPFHHRGSRAEGKGVEPSSPLGGATSRSPPPVGSVLIFKSVHPNTDRCPDFQSAELVSSRWTNEPVSFKWTAKESHPHFRRARLASSFWTSSPFSDPGWARTIVTWVSVRGVFAAGPRDHCSSRGGNRTHKHQALELAALPVLRAPAVKLRRSDLNRRGTAYETVLETGLQSTPQ